MFFRVRFEKGVSSMSAVLHHSSREFQDEVDHRFHVLARYWRDLYSGSDLFSVIHQERHHRLLGWCRQLTLPPGARVLDIGCGAGVQAVDLALSGAVVDGLDPVHAMVELGRKRAEEYRVAGQVHFVVGDAHHLPYPDESYDVVIAMGVLPYLYDPTRALDEIRRVLKPNGYVIVSSHNTYRMAQLLDPRFSVFTRPLRDVAHRLTRDKFRHTVPVRTFTLDALSALLANNSLSMSAWQSFGFGPFSFLGFHPFTDKTGVAIHRRFQAAADRGVPVLKNTGNQHLVLARKSGARSPRRPLRVSSI